MDNENEFKRILQEKLGDRDFSFDPAAWEQARNIIDGSRKKDRAVPMMLWLSGGGLLLLGFLGFFIFNEPSEYEVAENITTTVRHTGQNEPITVTETSEEKSAGKSQTHAPENSASDVQKVKQSISAEHSAANGSSSAEARKLKTAAAWPVKLKNGEGEKKESTKSQEPVFATKMTPVSDQQPATTSQSPVVINPRATSAVEPEDLSPNSPIVKDSAISVASNNKIVPGASTAASANEQTAKGDSVTLKANTAIVSVTAASPDTSTARPPSEPRKYTNVFSAEAGFDYLLGWKTPAGRDAKGYNAVLGFSYKTKVSEKFIIGTGLYFHTVSGLKYSTRTSKVIRYGLGEESAVTSITPNTLVYVTVPLKMAYIAGKNDMFGAGISVSYLMNVYATEEKYNYKVVSVSDYSKTRTFGYTDGFKSFNTGINLFYQRRIAGNFSLNTDIMIGLTDIKNNGFFNTDGFERNSGIRFTLVYDIFKK